jgi:hypothetical protein
MAVQIVDGVGGAFKAEVTADHRLQINPPILPEEAGFVNLACESDSGSFTGTRSVRSIDISQDYRMRTGVDSLLFNAKFPGTALSTSLWTQILSTMTCTVAAGFVNLNPGLSTASGAYAQLRSYRHFPLYGTFGLWLQAEVQLSQVPIANNVVEIGAFLATTTATPTDGVFLRYNAAGEARLIINFAGSETQSNAFVATSVLSPNVSHKITIGIFDSNAELWVDNVLITSLAVPASQGDISACGQLPFAARIINSGVTSSAQQIKIGLVNVTLADANVAKLWSHTMAGMGGHGYEGQAGGTMGSTALYSNNLAAGTGIAATNTTAALGSGLGGQFALLPTLTAGTDGIISSFLNPVGTNAIPGRCLYIRGIRIHGVVTTALTGGPVIAAWSCAFGHTTVTLVGASDGVTAKVPRRIPMGIQVFAVTAAVGARDDREVFLDLETPICVQPGEYIQTVLKNLGTVTTAGVITFLINVDGYWE